MSELSHAAKAILVAEAKSRCLREGRGCHPTNSDWNGCWICVHRKGLAAALRAAADQVVPEQGDVRTQDLRARAWIRFEECELIRRKFLAIADELEAQ